VNLKEIKINQLDSFCTALTHNLMKEHEKRFGDKIRSVREASAGLNNAGGRLAAGVKNAWGTMEKQVVEYGIRLAQTIQEKAKTYRDRKQHLVTTKRGFFIKMQSGH